MFNKMLKIQMEINLIPYMHITLYEFFQDTTSCIQAFLEKVNKCDFILNNPKISQQIIDSVCEYFEKSMKYIDSGFSNQTSFVTCIDSMALKSELLMRQIFIKHGFSTKKTDKYGNVGENFITDMLQDKNTEQLYDDDDLCFLKYVLVDDMGLNLRNSVAHCLSTDIYTWTNASLIFLCLLVILFKTK